MLAIVFGDGSCVCYGGRFGGGCRFCGFCCCLGCGGDFWRSWLFAGGGGCGCSSDGGSCLVLEGPFLVVIVTVVLLMLVVVVVVSGVGGCRGGGHSHCCFTACV